MGSDLAFGLSVSISLVLGLLVYAWRRQQSLISSAQSHQLTLIAERLNAREYSQKDLFESIHKLLEQQNTFLQAQRAMGDEHQVKSLKMLQDSMDTVRTELRNTLGDSRQRLDIRMQELSKRVEETLKEISGQVEKRLSDGFEKTTDVFQDVMKRLTLIDEAQKKMSELSGQVIDLQSVLTDKRSRGAFGEVQLMNLVRNMMPENCFAEQYTLSSGVRADCMLFLPEPTGNIAVDAKFPLESYQGMLNCSPEASADLKAFRAQFKLDIRKHIQDIAEKYILPSETADGAMMFIPAEAVFAEIYAHYPELVLEAQRAKVWLVSPTTLMAVLTTATAVLKDVATRKQVHLIRDHLLVLGQDFERFQQRMDGLSRHIRQAHEDVDLVHKSSRKLTSRFTKIEQVELAELSINSLEDTHEDPSKS